MSLLILTPTKLEPRIVYPAS